MIDARGGLWKAPALSFYGVTEEFMRWLIGEGADIHCADQYGQTPLHHHAGMWNGLPEVLLQAGADPNARDGSDGTPLFDATASTDWPSQFTALWDYLVPAAGPSGTPQGEASTLARSLNGGRASDDELYRIRELAVLWVSAQE